MQLFLSRQTVIHLILALWYTALSASAFSFSYTNPTQCGDLTVNWQGGQPPFRLLVLPPSQVLKNISIPDSAFKDNAGSFTTQLAIVKDTRVMFAMSDATAVDAGGISPLLTVGAQKGGANCSTVLDLPDFFFSLDGDLQECMSYPFTAYPNAVQPVTIEGFIPSGQYFSTVAPQGNTYAWKNPYPAGTPISFTMTDSQGRSGGSSGIKTVMSGDKSCLNGDTSLISNPPPTASKEGNKREDTINLIIGVVVSVVALLVVGAGLFYFLWWRRQRASAKFVKNLSGPYELLAPNTKAPEGAPELVSSSTSPQSVSPYHLVSMSSSHHQSVTPFPLPIQVSSPPSSFARAEKTLYTGNRPSTASLASTVGSVGSTSMQQAGSSRLPVTTTTYQDPFTSPILSPPATSSNTGLYKTAIESHDLPPEYTETGPLVAALTPQRSATPLQPLRRS